LGCLACGHESIAVGAYNVYDDLKPCSFSSAGPTRDSRQKPDLSAPGERVLAARSRSLDKTIAMRGTSMATPVVAGIVALLLAEAEGLGIRLEGHEIREILRRAARLDPPEQVWHSRYGWGRVDARGAILAFRAQNSPPAGMGSPESGS
jgi:subtilisin family serine protease